MDKENNIRIVKLICAIVFTMITVILIGMAFITNETLGATIMFMIYLYLWYKFISLSGIWINNGDNLHCQKCGGILIITDTQENYEEVIGKFICDRCGEKGTVHKPLDNK